MEPSVQLKGKTSRPQSEPLLSLLMIVKNEERVLADCLRSVVGVVDEMVIVDTGSTDRTVQIAESFNAKVFHYPWDGSFSNARNAALEHCTCNYVLFLDADERLEQHDRNRLRALVHRPSSDVYELTLVSKRTEGGRVLRTTSDQARLFRRDERFRFRYRIHESILPSVNETKGVITKEHITIHHIGYDVSAELMERKKVRNYEQLILDVREHPCDLFVLKKYLQTLLMMSKIEEASVAGKEALEKIDAGLCGRVSGSSRAAFCNLYAEALMQSDDFSGAHRWTTESLRSLKEQNKAHYLLTIINDHMGRYEEALRHLNSIVLQKKDGAPSQAEDEITPAPQDVCYKRASLYRMMKQPLNERRELGAALRFDPSMTTALFDLAALMAKENNFSQALSIISKAGESEPANGSIWHFRSKILYHLQRKEEALRDAARAFELGERSDGLLVSWIQTARDLKKEAEAFPAFALMSERHPEASDILLAYIQMLVNRNEISTTLNIIEASLHAVKDASLRQVLSTIHTKLLHVGAAQ
jgi:glycosyltransferase involved in cell wall biosynthesis/thioredoxin-like negative regulator of GroEL